MNQTRHAGIWTIEDRCESTWHYLPFNVPAGTGALRVELDYDRSAAVLDLGCLGPAGFRGWSGGARRFFVIGADSATPGYLSGEPEPGTWLAVVGLHRIPAGGIKYELTASAAGNTAQASDPGPAQPVTDRLARYAASRGLEFLAVTDHNTISHHGELPAASADHGIALLPGQEVTTENGHANAFGDTGWIDFREPPEEWLACTERAGGLLSVNHPYGGQVSWT